MGTRGRYTCRGDHWSSHRTILIVFNRAVFRMGLLGTTNGRPYRVVPIRTSVVPDGSSLKQKQKTDARAPDRKHNGSYVA